MTLRVLECFAGIGACSKALTNLGIDHEIVDAIEIDKYAIKSFNAVHGTNFEPQDITKWDKSIGGGATSLCTDRLAKISLSLVDKLVVTKILEREAL